MKSDLGMSALAKEVKWQNPTEMNELGTSVPLRIWAFALFRYF